MGWGHRAYAVWLGWWWGGGRGYGSFRGHNALLDRNWSGESDQSGIVTNMLTVLSVLKTRRGSGNCPLDRNWSGESDQSGIVTNMLTVLSVLKTRRGSGKVRLYG